jgi:K+-sensing histidine kinase KdpD
VLQGIMVLIESSKTKFIYNFEPTLTLNTNAAYFESIILNLVTNAIKYKLPSQTPEIQISIYKQQNFKIISFKDNGLGIDLKRHSDKIFGMYKTFHGNKDAKDMGLFIVKTQIEAMGGKIEIQSNVGEGTTFKIYFLDNMGV